MTTDATSLRPIWYSNARAFRGLPLYVPATLVISYDAIRCEFASGLRWIVGPDVVHRQSSVVMVRSHLIAPLLPRLLKLVGQRGEIVYVTPWGGGWDPGIDGDLEARGYRVSNITRWLL